MMKIFALCLSIVVITVACDSKKNQEQIVGENQKQKSEPNDLPAMEVQLLNGQSIYMKERNGKIALILFQPDCEDCQREATEIRNNLQKFEGYDLYFVSSHPLEVIADFASDYNFTSESNVYFGRTTVEEVLDNFGAIPAPSVYLFEESGKLKAKFNGETSIDTIGKSL